MYQLTIELSRELLDRLRKDAKLLNIRTRDLGLILIKKGYECYEDTLVEISSKIEGVADSDS